MEFTMSRAAVLEGLGAAVPAQVITNDMLATRMDTSDEWIYSRTGIRERRLIDRGVTTSDLATEAGRRALKSAGITTVDAVVLATTTPDHQCPATAPTVSSRLDMGTVPAYDVAAVCSGFVYALTTGAGLIALGTAERVLVIGADAFTTIINPDDRNTAPIFGDGAGAVVLRAGDSTEWGALHDFELCSDGNLADLIIVPAGGAKQRASGRDATPEEYFLTMQGKEVFRNAVIRMAEAAHTVLDRSGWPIESVDWLVGHQANARILRAVSQRLGLPQERAFLNIDRYGNTAAGSIPLALDEAAATGKLQPGHRVLLTAFGAGATWGAITLVWPDVLPA
jgi:3-oxoacyl-(acyl-carrier-protein) synthase III